MNDDLITYTFSEATDLDFKPPTLWYVRDAMGNFVFVKGRSRQKAQQLVDDEYGTRKYIVSSSKLF